MDYIGKFKEKMMEQGKSTNTIEGYVRDLNQFREWYKGINADDTSLAQASQLELNEYKKLLQDKPYTFIKDAQGVEQGKYYSIQSINRKLVALNSFFKFLFDNKYLDRELKIEVIENKDKVKFKGMEKSDIWKLRREVDKFGSKRDKVIFELLSNTGIRVSELVDIKLQDLELLEIKGKLTIRKGKGNAVRSVHLNNDVVKTIKNYLEERGRIEGADRDYLLQGQRGRMSRKGIDSVLKKYADRLHLKVSPHMLRHTLAYKLINGGTPITTIKDILGHNDLNTTLIYTQTTDEDMERALDNIEW